MDTQKFANIYGKRIMSELCADLLRWEGFLKEAQTNTRLNKNNCKTMIAALTILIEHHIEENAHVNEKMKDIALENI